LQDGDIGLESADIALYTCNVSFQPPDIRLERLLASLKSFLSSFERLKTFFKICKNLQYFIKPTSHNNNIIAHDFIIYVRFFNNLGDRVYCGDERWVRMSGKAAGEGKAP
jgi:hypothetical protein